MYRIIHVRIYTAAISEVIREVVAWPGVGEGICSVPVEYTYVSIIIYFSVTPLTIGTESGVGVTLYTDMEG